MKILSLILFLAVTASCAELSASTGGKMTATSFETAADLEHVEGDNFALDESRFQFGSKSLKWSGKPLTISNIRSLSPEESGAKYGSHFPISPTFVMSLYNAKPLNDSLRVEFNGKVHFNLNLNFKGWRTVWVPFFEMDGPAPAPEAPYPVQTIRLVAPDSAETLWLDDMVFSQYVDNRHPYPGLEVPFIKNGGAQVHDHWMPKIPHWKMLSQLGVSAATAKQLSEVKTIRDRLRAVYEKKVSHPVGAERFRKKMSFDLPLKMGKQVSPIRYTNREYNDLREFGKWMLKLAQECLSTKEAESQNLFAEATRYDLDQGWSAGSSQGTAHHIGYSTRELQIAFFLMKDVLNEKGLLDAVGDSVRWQLNFGEMLDPEQLESNLDYYNTQSVFRMMSAFLTSDPSRQAALLNIYSSHLSAALALTDSTGGFKPDGTAWHHWGHYPAYATGAFDRVPVSLKALSGTSFRIGEAGHANFKRAFLAAAIYSNPFYWGLGQAGRHPLGGNINKLKNACLSLALSGSPDGKQPIDVEVASVYVRLWGNPPDAVFQTLEKQEGGGSAFFQGLEKLKGNGAAVPTGHWTFPYAALSVHRRADWSVNIKGYNKYVWASEIYALENRYGRYQSSGVVQILPNMTQEDAGYTEDGWDWNHPPGATTIERPFKELEPDNELVMFKSEESYAGGCTLAGNGVWAMKLNEADGFTIDPVKEKMSFPGDLKACKSVFCFDNQILCLGSGITSDDPSAPVHTTLFQNSIKQIDGAVRHDGNQLIDPIGNEYKILDGAQPVITVGEQSSPNNEYSLRKGEGKKGAVATATGLFAKAWIDHGAAPENASYAYIIFPRVGNRSHRDAPNFPNIGIPRQDNRAHIVEYSNTTAYACFEAGVVGVGALESVSVPCYVMIQSGRALKISVANPDLNQEEDPVLGHFNGPSRVAPVTLRLKGCWIVTGDANAWAETEGGSTLLTVKCRDGLSIETHLEMYHESGF